MPNYALSDPRLAAILRGDAPWPTEEELTSMATNPKPPDAPPADAPQVMATAMPVTQGAPTDGSTQTLPDGRVIAGAADAPFAAAMETYTPHADVTETDALGVVTLLAAKGVPIPRAEAQRLGLIKHGSRHGPEETKTDA